jgi:hypothetical protein
MRRTISATLTSGLAVGLLAATGASAQAVTLQTPFPCGTTIVGKAYTGHSPVNAIDFNGPGGGDTDLGWPVVAAADGTVRGAGYSTTTGYGNNVEITHAGGVRTFYAHLQSFSVKAGQKVKRGQVIGKLGKSSAKYSFSAHLHYEQRSASGAVVVPYFNGKKALEFQHFGIGQTYKSTNCGTSNPTPNPPTPPSTGGGGGRVGVKLPNISKRRAATISTDNGLRVSARKGRTTSSAIVRKLASGASVSIVCQANGQRVKGKFGVSRLWDLIDLGNGRGAWVTDTYVSTGSDGRVAPRCS